MVDRVDALNLALRVDHSFRWSLSGCDTFGGDMGRVMVTSKSRIVLLPQAGSGKNTFLWVAGIAVSQVPEVQLDIADKHLLEPNTSEQTWLPGGVCSICGNTLGPTGQEACDEPRFF